MHAKGKVLFAMSWFVASELPDTSRINGCIGHLPVVLKHSCFDPGVRRCLSRGCAMPICDQVFKISSHGFQIRQGVRLIRARVIDEGYSNMYVATLSSVFGSNLNGTS